MTSCQWSVCFRWVSNHTLTPANAGMSNIIAIQISHSMVVLLSELYGESALCARSHHNGHQLLLRIAFGLKRQHTELSKLNFVWCPYQLWVQLKARTLEVLHQPAVFQARLANRQAKDCESAAAAPVAAELLADQVPGWWEVPDQLRRAG